MVLLKFSDLIRVVPISSCFCLACPLIFFAESYLSLTWLTGSFAWQTTHSRGRIFSCVPEQSIFQPFYNCIAHNVSHFATTIVWYQIASIATWLLWYRLFWCSLQGWELRIIIHYCRNIPIVDNMFWGIVPFAMWCLHLLLMAIIKIEGQFTQQCLLAFSYVTLSVTGTSMLRISRAERLLKLVATLRTKHGYPSDSWRKQT